MQKFALPALVLAAGCFLTSVVLAAGTEVQTPDGRTAVLYEDGTWEYKRPAPVLEANTVGVDELVLKPSQFQDQEVIVTGKIVRVFGKNLLQSENGQNTMGVDVSKVRRADQIALEDASKAVGLTGAVTAQIRGKVILGTVTYRLDAEDIVILQ